MDELTAKHNQKTVKKMAQQLKDVAELLEQNGLVNPWHAQEIADEIARIDYKIRMAVHQ